MTELQPTTMRPTPKSRTVESEELLGQELFLYKEESGIVVTLNSGAAMIWVLCDGILDLGAISAQIASASGIPEEEALDHVRKSVGRFGDLGLLED